MFEKTFDRVRSDAVIKAQNIYIRSEVERILSTKEGRLDAFLYYVSLHRTRAVEVFCNAVDNAQVKYQLDMDDCLRKAAECMADEAYHHLAPLRDVA